MFVFVCLSKINLFITICREISKLGIDSKLVNLIKDEKKIPCKQPIDHSCIHINNERQTIEWLYYLLYL